MRELSLFSGAGGGLLGTKLLGWTPVGYVEWDEYCQRVLQQRIKDGYLHNAPIFGDIREFNRTYAGAYTGMVDVVTGGFPCQPFSVAGKRAGEDDPRNMWPATIECIRLVRPRYAFLENVPGLLSSGYFGTILGDLAESGYGVRWRILSAAEVGAPHKRDRLWLLADAENPRPAGREWEPGDGAVNGHAGRVRPGGRGSDAGRKDVADAIGHRLEGGGLGGEFAGSSGLRGGAGSDEKQGIRNAAGEGLANGSKIEMEEPETVAQPERSDWWTPEPRLGRLADGVPNRVDRLRAAGNAQVPAVVATAWRLLTDAR